MSFVVEFATTGPEFGDFGDGDTAAEVLRRVAAKLEAGDEPGTITGKGGEEIGTFGFMRSGSEEIAELRHRIREALEYLMSVDPRHEYVDKAADILRGDE